MNEYINNSFINHKHNRLDAIDIPLSEKIKNDLTRLNMEWVKKWVLTYADGSQEIVFADNFFELSQKVKGKRFININFVKE